MPQSLGSLVGIIASSTSVAVLDAGGTPLSAIVEKTADLLTTPLLFRTGQNPFAVEMIEREANIVAIDVFMVPVNL